MYSAVIKAARPVAVGALIRYFEDMDLAEDAFQEACLRALKTWPESGDPRDPVAWLVKVGRNIGLDHQRKHGRLTALPDAWDLPGQEQSQELELDERHYRDDVLRLLFTCCHPVLTLDSQVILACKVIIGLSVPEIARAFLVKPKTMEQRITRAKKQIAGSGEAYAVPAESEKAERLRGVLACVYLLFNEGYSSSADQAHIRVALCEEAIRLARLLVRLIPSDSEIQGLLALCLLQHARKQARLDNQGRMIPLDEQDRSLWDTGSIAEGLIILEKALLKRRFGSFQIQAAIAAVHARSVRAEDTDWSEILRLYTVLEHIQPSAVVVLNRAVAVLQVEGPQAALNLVEPLEEKLYGYFHFHTVKAQLLRKLNREKEAQQSFQEALVRAGTPAEEHQVRWEMKKKRVIDENKR